MNAQDVLSRYALIDGIEVVLREVIPHAVSGEPAYVFEDSAKRRGYVFKSEWLKGVQAFSSYASRQGLVTSESASADKVALFRSLFKGREDVYAHGFLGRQGKIGYVPTCANDRTPSCPRWTKTDPKAKCAACPSRSFVALNDRALISHFQGKSERFDDVVGLYVLTKECKTWLLVADFDKEGWKHEVSLYCAACKQFGLPFALERSRSGRGGHVWVFFEEELEAELARNLGCALISTAMSFGGAVDFGAYDRLFPSQSTVVEGGFGSLIALPLQGRAQRKGNSVFVDECFEPYADQWRFLSSISRVSRLQAQEVVESIDGGPLGALSSFASEKTSSFRVAVDARSALERDRLGGSKELFPQSVSARKNGMLAISKQGLSSQAQNRVRRLAAFGNPEFYRAQSMHRSVYGKSRIVWCGEETDRDILIPRGCEEKLNLLVESFGSHCMTEDIRRERSAIKATFEGALRPRQQQAADALLREECGVLSAPTGFGKTVIGAYLIGQLCMRTLVIVPKTALLAQWRQQLDRFLSLQDDRPPLLTKAGKPSKRKRPVIGGMGGGTTSLSGIVDVATFQSLIAKDDLGAPCVKDYVDDYDLVICDECHYAAAAGLELVMKRVSARRVYGLSATPRRSDGLEGVVFMHCGSIRHVVSPREQAEEQGFSRILLPRFTHIRLSGLEPGTSFNQVVDRLCAHDRRNRLIVDDVFDSLKAGRTPLVVTKRKSHAFELGRLLKERSVDVIVLTGVGTAREKREKLQEAKSMQKGWSAIVATGSYIGEGFDLPRLDTLFLASPYSWEGIITQYSGRLHREFEGKRNVMVYDYVDASVPMLERMYKRRLKAYAKLGYETAAESETQGMHACIMTVKTWHARLVDDISHAQKNVLIAPLYIGATMPSSVESALVDALERGVSVRVVVKGAKSPSVHEQRVKCVERLLQVGCEASIDEAPVTGVAVIDDAVVWHGTIPLLAFPRSDDCSLRIESPEIAFEVSELFRGVVRGGH